ncbi:diacylglycerol kinase family lipid kinase, partial [Candidatus Saccharibacteria bacterium]|nr:diacylglycerol kinase family lipid kinase [Candidatus Saccharibacteria bacterium]
MVNVKKKPGRRIAGNKKMDKKIKKVLFIINPISGINRRQGRIGDLIHQQFNNSGIQYEIVNTSHQGHGTTLAKEAVDNEFDMVVATGGDGTINEIGRGLVGSETALGIIPAGSGNGFSRNMKIPLAPRAAIELLRHPRLKEIDVGKINDHYFFNIAGIGIDAEITAKFNSYPIRGPLPYFIVGIREFFRFRPQPVSLHLEEREVKRSPILLCFANLPEYGVNAIIAPKARPDDGLVDICILSPVNMAKALINIPKLFNGKIEDLSEMEIFQTRKAVIHREDNGPIHTDGDLYFE